MLGRRTLLLLIILLSLFGPISTDMFLSALPDMVTEFGTTEAVMSMIMYLFMLSLAVSVLILGPLSDKYGRRIVLSASLIVYIATSFLCCLATDVWTLIALRVVQAVGGAGSICISMALIKDCFKGREMGQALSITAALGILGPILAPIVGTVLINALDWRATFWAPALIALLCLVLTMGIPRELPLERYQGTIAGSLGNLVSLVRDRDFTAFAVMMTVFSLTLLAYISVSSYIYQETFGLSSTHYSMCLAATMIAGILLATLIKRIGERRGNLFMVGSFLVLGLLCFLMLSLIAPIHWALFLASMIPCTAIPTMTRSFGFGILLNQRENDSGAISSVLNFGTFGFACIGMVIATLPWPSFIVGLSACALLCCTVFAVLWVYVRNRGYRIKGLV